MLTSKRPYLIKALYNWLADNGSKIYISVNTLYENINIPKEFIDSRGYVTLNITEDACGYISMTSDDYIELEIRFNQIPYEFSIHYNAIDSIFDPINNDGMAFEPVEPPKVVEKPVPTEKDKGKSFMKLVK